MPSGGGGKRAMNGRLMIAAVLSLAVAAHLAAIGTRPDTVFFEDLTFQEIRDAIAAGTTNVLIAAGGLADEGPGLVAGTPTDVATYTADRIARGVGDMFVAPIIAYAPEGLVSVPPQQGYAALLEAAAVSARGSGFTHIFFLGETASGQVVMQTVAERLDAAWRNDGVRLLHVSDYATRARSERDKYVADTIRVPLNDAAERDRFARLSEALAINSRRVRLDQGDSPAAAAPAPHHGLALLALKVNAAVAQIRTLLARTGTSPVQATVGPRVLPTPNPFVSLGPSLFLEDLTSDEIRETVAKGSTIVILPTGGTEKNGFHMAVGKHNFHVRAGAGAMAQKLGNALIAPVLQYAPEAQSTIAAPGVLSCGRDCFEPVVAGMARSLRALGFKDVLLVGDNGGNQGPLNSVATLLNKEWEGSGIQAFALTDFYDKGHEYQDAWFLGQFGWDASVVGSHAGIKDTSQLLYVKPADVRQDRILDSFTNKGESGISGDPTKATVEFGRVAIEFKANAAIAQYRAAKARRQQEARSQEPGNR